MAVVLVSCKKTLTLLYVPAKYMCNVMNGGVFADFIVKVYLSVRERLRDKENEN